MRPLSRQNAVAYATRRLHGPVALASPLSVRLLAGLLGGIIACAAIFAVSARSARKATVAEWLAPDLGFIKATTQAPGLVRRLLVSEGQLVEHGGRVAELRRSGATDTEDVQFVTAPTAGRIAVLPVTAGQSVPAGATIAILLPVGNRLAVDAPGRPIALPAEPQSVGHGP